MTAPGFDPVAAEFPATVPSAASYGELTNNTVLRLGAAITATDLVIPIAEDISGVPDAGVVTIGLERIKYSSKGIGTLIVSSLADRGFDGSVAAVHAYHEFVYWNRIAHHYNKLAVELRATQVSLGTNLVNLATQADLDAHVIDTSTHGVTGDIAGTGDANVWTSNQKLNDDVQLIFGTGDDATVKYVAVDNKVVTTGVTQRFDSEVQFKAGPWFDVKAFGAVGDGVTDDTAAIQAASTAAGIGGRVLFSAGSYKTTGIITPLEGQTFAGVGKTSKLLLRITAGNKYGIQVSNLNSVTIRDIYLDGGNDIDTGIRFDTGGTGNAVIGCYFYDFPVTVTTSCIGVNTADHVAVRDCNFDTCRNYAVATNSTNHITVSGCHSFGSVGHVAFNLGTSHSQVIGCTFEIVDDVAIGIKLNGCTDCSAVGNTVRGTFVSPTNSKGITVSQDGVSTCFRNKVIGNTISGFQYGVEASFHPFYTLVEGNQISSCDTGIKADQGGIEEISLIGNYVYNCTTGIQAEVFHGALTNNVLHTCTTGVVLSSGSRFSVVGPNQYRSCTTRLTNNSNNQFALI